MTKARTRFKAAINQMDTFIELYGEDYREMMKDCKYLRSRQIAALLHILEFDGEPI